MSTRFRIRDYDQRVCDRLASAGVMRPLARALAARGVTCAEDMAEDWRSMIAPTLLEGADKAARILADARDQGAHVTIVADYDCDGATACAVAMKGFRAMGLSCGYIVPDRFRYGYGLSPDIVDLANESQHPDLIVTVDNGIASVEGVARANQLGIRVIITDHHLQGETLPEAACIVNPNVRTSSFASKALCGCGVMYYVLLALRAELRRRGVFTAQTQPRLDALADLVALGTVADVVCLDKNNRILVAQGLARVRRGLACPGIQALFEVAGRDPGRASVRDFAFSIAPRINAAGRMDEMNPGIDCLLADSYEAAHSYAEQLELFNNQRRNLEGTMQSEALESVQAMDWENKATVTLFDVGWHQGVVGLVASRVKERIHRPVIAFAPSDDGELKGSGRSIEGVHLKDALDRVVKKDPQVITRFGGHAMAAGLTIRPENLQRFTALFEQAVSEMTPPELFDRTVLVDGALSPEEVNFPLVDALSTRIWGQGFERPLFANDFTILSQRILKGAHLKLLVDLGGTRFEAIYFRRSEPLPQRVRLAYRPETNEFMGRKSVQLVIEASED